MKKYYFYMIQDDFYGLFKGDNLKAFLELFFRKEESCYYEKQFQFFIKELDIRKINDILCEKFNCRKDFVRESNKYILDNFITFNKETLKLYHDCIFVDTDNGVSHVINILSDNFPDLVGIDVNNYKIEGIGLVSSKNIS